MRLQQLISEMFYRYYFIHIPKNGGISIRDYFKNRRNVYLPEVLHNRYRDADSKFKEKLRFFSIIRNPWSRTASRFIYAKDRAQRWADDDPRKIYILECDFTQYVRDQRIFSLPQFPNKPWMGPMSSWLNQLEWLIDEDGIVRCDCLRFEYFDNDLSNYFDRHISLPRSNISRTKYDYRAMYTDEVAEIIADIFSDDIEYFGFTFDSEATRNIAI